MLTIRQCDPESRLEEITSLLNRAHKPFADLGLRYAAATQGACATRRRIGKGTCYVAELDATLVGVVVYKEPSVAGGQIWYDHPAVASFSQLAVDPACHGRSIGEALIHFVEEEAAKDSAAELALDTSERARRLVRYYSRHGYRIVDYTFWRDTNYRSVVMSKTMPGRAPVSVSLVGRLAERNRRRLAQLRYRLIRSVAGEA